MRNKDLNIHHVTKIKIEDKEHGIGKSAFKVRNIIIIDEDGDEFNITLFLDDNFSE